MDGYDGHTGGAGRTRLVVLEEDMSNTTSWETYFIAKLRQRGLGAFEHMTYTQLNDLPADQRDAQQQNNLRAMGELTLTLPEIHAVKLRDCRCASEMLARIKETWRGMILPNGLRLGKQMATLALRTADDETVREYVARARALVVQLAQIGEAPTDTALLGVVLNPVWDRSMRWSLWHSGTRTGSTR